MAVDYGQSFNKTLLHENLTLGFFPWMYVSTMFLGNIAYSKNDHW